MDLLSNLTQIGFTEYEAKVYLALLSDSPSTGYQLSKASGVPRSMVYEALSRLHNRGAVLESIEDRATVYRPLPPDLLLARHQEEQLQLVENLRGGLLKLYNASVEDRVWMLSSRRSIVTYTTQMIERSQKEVFLVLDSDDVSALGEVIAQSCDRGISIHALMTGDATLTCGEVVRHPPLESELHGLTGMLLVVSDGTEALIAGGDQELAAVTRNPHLVGIARQFVWMEFFTQRIYARIGDDLLDRLDLQDRQIFESLNQPKETRDARKESHET